MREAGPTKEHAMTWVYLLRSLSDPDCVYIGLTEHLDERLAQHNSPKESGYTAKHQPWTIEVAIRFKERKKAQGFETYLKSGSGHAFAKRHLW
jgi:predicted GIY-YIG superfamily endonuclease